jgi:hypothetical protein
MISGAVLMIFGQTRTYYVSVSGDDYMDGSAENPFRTIPPVIWFTYHTSWLNING